MKGIRFLSIFVLALFVLALLVARPLVFAQPAQEPASAPRPEPRSEPVPTPFDPLVIGTPSPVDSKPKPLNDVKPSYTLEARRNRVEGVVLGRIVIGENGKVKKFFLIRGLPDGLNESARKAAMKLKFKPAMKDGKPVAYVMAIEIAFNLRK